MLQTRYFASFSSGWNFVPPIWLKYGCDCTYMFNFSRAQTGTTSTHLEKHAPNVVPLAEIWDCSHSRFSFSRKLVCHVLDSARVNSSNNQNQPLQLAISIFHFGSWWARVWLTHISFITCFQISDLTNIRDAMARGYKDFWLNLYHS